jgi:hypothetical protein
LTLQEQHQNILEGFFSKDDDYADWIKCATVEECSKDYEKALNPMCICFWFRYLMIRLRRAIVDPNQE